MNVRELLEFLVYIVCVFTLVAGLLFTCLYTADRWQCATYTEVTGTVTQYQGLHCYIETDRGWMIWSEYEPYITAKRLEVDVSERPSL